MKHVLGLTDLLSDRIATHTVYLMRFEADMRRRLERLLKQLEADIVRQMLREDPTQIRRPTFRDRRLLSLYDQTQRIISAAYREVDRTANGDLRQVANLEANFSAESINRAIGVDVVSVSVPETLLREIARNTVIEGAKSRDWWAGQARRTQALFERQVRIGLLAGEGMPEIVRRIRGTRDAGFTDGIMRVSRRDAAALVRTSVQAVSGGARMAVYEANDDVIRGTRWQSTLDGRTTPICIALSNAAWSLDGKPLPESEFRGPDPGGPPAHWGCRSTRVAVLKPLSQILRDAGVRKASALRAAPESTQASMDGQVGSALSFADWLKRKEAAGPAFANRVLGKVRAELWRQGKLPLHRLIDQNANPLSLEGLRRSVRSVTLDAIEEARAA